MGVGDHFENRSFGQDQAPLVSLSSSGLDGGSIATLAGGTIYDFSQSFAAMPAGADFGDTFLAAGTNSGALATLTFTTPVTNFGFNRGAPSDSRRYVIGAAAKSRANTLPTEIQRRPLKVTPIYLLEALSAWAAKGWVHTIATEPSTKQVILFA